MLIGDDGKLKLTPQDFERLGRIGIGKDGTARPVEDDEVRDWIKDLQDGMDCWALMAKWRRHKVTLQHKIARVWDKWNLDATFPPPPVVEPEETASNTSEEDVAQRAAGLVLELVMPELERLRNDLFNLHKTSANGKHDAPSTLPHHLQLP